MRALVAVGVEPEGEQAGHARHDHVRHQRHHHQSEDEGAQQGGEQVEPLTEDREDHRDHREDREPGDGGHLVARRRRLPDLGGQREPDLQPGEDVDLLLLLQY
jgi:hypothetical protein